MDIKEIIRVDHAGERGAIRIYEGQLAAYQLTKKDPEMEKLIIEMKGHEQEHLEYFENQLAQRGLRPTALLPLWDIAGFTLGFASGLLGKKTAMQVTASVESNIDGHYQEQIDWVKDNEPLEKELADKMTKFREDELSHRDTAFDHGADYRGPLKALDALIQIGCKVAIKATSKI